MERLRRVSISVKGIPSSELVDVLALMYDVFNVESVKVQYRRYRGREL